MDISVITTTYNRKNYLEEAIESVQKSVFTPLEGVTFEHIVYDDGSTDGTDQLFSEHSWPHVRYMRGQENRGESYGRNHAIAEALGTYILPLDSDDIILQRTLYNFLTFAKENPGIDWFFSGFLHTDDELHYLPGQDYWGWNYKNIPEMLKSIFRGYLFIQGNVFFRKELFLKVGGYDESMRIGPDLDLYVRFLLHGKKPTHLNFISHLHRFHSTNVSEGITPEIHRVWVGGLYEKYKDQLEKKSRQSS